MLRKMTCPDKIKNINVRFIFEKIKVGIYGTLIHFTYTLFSCKPHLIRTMVLLEILLN